MKRSSNLDRLSELSGSIGSDNPLHQDLGEVVKDLKEVIQSLSANDRVDDLQEQLNDIEKRLSSLAKHFNGTQVRQTEINRQFSKEIQQLAKVVEARKKISSADIDIIRAAFIQHYLSEGESGIRMGLKEDAPLQPINDLFVNLMVVRSDAQHKKERETLEHHALDIEVGAIDEASIDAEKLFVKEFQRVIISSENIDETKLSGEVLFVKLDKENADIITLYWLDSGQLKECSLNRANYGDLVEKLHPKDKSKNLTKSELSDKALIQDITNACHIERALFRNIMLEGRPGVGKSVLCRYFSHQSATKKLWANDFQWVFYLRLRDVQSHGNLEKTVDMDDLFYYMFFVKFSLPWSDAVKREKSTNFWQWLQEAKNERSLFLLDGYDEIAGHEHPICDRLINLHSSLEKHFYFFISSRNFVSSFKGAQEVRLLSNIGLRKDQAYDYIQKYFRKYFEVDLNGIEQKYSEEERGLVNTLKLWLNKNTTINALCTIPIYLAIICDLWSDESERAKLESQGKVSVTSLYYRMMINLTKQYIFRLHPGQTKNIELMSDAELLQDPEAERMLKFTSSLAHQTFQSDRLVISEEEQIASRLEQTKGANNKQSEIEKLKGTPFLQYSTKCAWFLHLTFQEFFFAYYFAIRMSDGELSAVDKRFIEKNKYNPRYLLVLSYVAGIIRLDEKNYSDKLNKYFMLLLEEPRDLFGMYEFELLARCAEEARWSAANIQLINNLLYFLKTSIASAITLDDDTVRSNVFSYYKSRIISACPLAKEAIGSYQESRDQDAVTLHNRLSYLRLFTLFFPNTVSDGQYTYNYVTLIIDLALQVISSLMAIIYFIYFSGTNDFLAEVAGFQLIAFVCNFVIMPCFVLSGAMNGVDDKVNSLTINSFDELLSHFTGKKWVLNGVDVFSMWLYCLLFIQGLALKNYKLFYTILAFSIVDIYLYPMVNRCIPSPLSDAKFSGRRIISAFGGGMMAIAFWFFYFLFYSFLKLVLCCNFKAPILPNNCFVIFSDSNDSSFKAPFKDIFIAGSRDDLFFPLLKNYPHYYQPGSQNFFVNLLRFHFSKNHDPIFSVGKYHEKIVLLPKEADVAKNINHDVILLQKKGDFITAYWLKNDEQMSQAITVDKTSSAIQQFANQAGNHSLEDFDLIKKVTAQFGCTFNQFAWYEGRVLHRFTCDNADTLASDLKKARVFPAIAEEKNACFANFFQHQRPSQSASVVIAPR